MITPKKIQELLMEATASLPEIRKRVVVVTDDEFQKSLVDHRNVDNILMVAVLPSYSGYGEEDEGGVHSFMQFFLLEKTDYTLLKNNDEYIAVFERTLSAAKDFIKALFAMVAEQCYGEEISRDFTLRPVARKAECNGYELQIDSKMFETF